MPSIQLLIAGRYLTANGQKPARIPGSDEVRCRSLPLEYELVIFVCDNDNCWTRLGRELSNWAILLVCHGSFEKSDLDGDDNESQSHNYWEQFHILLFGEARSSLNIFRVLLCNEALRCGLLLFLKTPFGIHDQDSVCRFGRALIKALTSTWWLGISHFLLF